MPSPISQEVAAIIGVGQFVVTMADQILNFIAATALDQRAPIDRRPLASVAPRDFTMPCGNLLLGRPPPRYVPRVKSTHVPVRSFPQEQIAARHREIARRYARKRPPIDRGPLIEGRRRNEIEDLIRHRYNELPHTMIAATSCDIGLGTICDRSAQPRI